MSMDLNSLLNGQRDFNGRIARSVENLKKMGMNNITLSAIETRIRLLDQLWEKFEVQHDNIRACYKDNFYESEYVKSDLFDITENTYVQQRSILNEYSNGFKTAPPKATPPQEQSDNHASKTALPRIKLPHFSGAYEDWPLFRDSFSRSCLQEPAETLIRPLTVTGENYARAWTILSKRYENKKELIRSNFAAFTAVAKMKEETAEELSRIYHAVTTAVNVQESIGRPIDSYGIDLFNHLIVELFDPQTRLEWESSTCDSFDPPDHDALTSFITKRILTLNVAKPKINAKVSGDSSRSAKTHFTKHGTDSTQCALCKGKHTLMLCSEFKSKPASERKSVVETSRLCYNCLGNHLGAKCQSHKNCLTCKARHHTMLHDAYIPPKSAEVSALSAVRKADDRKAILLATARVTVADRHGNPHKVRVLIDQKSEVSIITEALAQRLRLPRSRSAVSIFGIGGVQSGSSRGKVTINFTSRTTGAKLSAVAFVLPRLSLYEGSQMKCSTRWPHIQGLPLADPQYAANDPVELLLGAEVCSVIFEDGLRKSRSQAPIAQRTILGWILSGGCGVTSLHGHRSSLQCTADQDLNELVHRFWEQEKEPPTTPAALTPEKQKCEDIFMRTHTSARPRDGTS